MHVAVCAAVSVAEGVTVSVAARVAVCVAECVAECLSPYAPRIPTENFPQVLKSLCACA